MGHVSWSFSIAESTFGAAAEVVTLRWAEEIWISPSCSCQREFHVRILRLPEISGLSTDRLCSDMIVICSDAS